MYIRWKTKKVKTSQFKDHLNYVQLVRIDRSNGKPQQKVIKYLASIRESQRYSPTSQRDFWKSVTENLNELFLSEEDREWFVNKISQTIPLP